MSISQELISGAVTGAIFSGTVRLVARELRVVDACRAARHA
jgi:hypothetical protein